MWPALRSPDFLSGIAFMAVGLGVALISQDYELGSLARVGPGFFPMMLGIFLTGIGALVAFRALPTPASSDPIHLKLRPTLCLIAAVLCFMALVERAGFVPAAFGASFIAMYADRTARLTRVLTVAALLTLLSLAIFVWALGMPLRAVNW